MDTDEIPESFEGIKRPTLQRLCKKFGLKANGKNVDMINALTELRETLTKDEPSVPSEDQSDDVTTVSLHDNVAPSSVGPGETENEKAVSCPTSPMADNDIDQQKQELKSRKTRGKGRAGKGRRKKAQNKVNEAEVSASAIADMEVSTSLQNGSPRANNSNRDVNTLSPVPQPSLPAPPSPYSSLQEPSIENVEQENTESLESPPSQIPSPRLASQSTSPECFSPLQTFQEPSVERSRKRDRDESLSLESPEPLQLSSLSMPFSGEPNRKRIRHDTYNLSPSPLHLPSTPLETEQGDTDVVSPPQGDSDGMSPPQGSADGMSPPQGSADGLPSLHTPPDSGRRRRSHTYSVSPPPGRVGDTTPPASVSAAEDEELKRMLPNDAQSGSRKRLRQSSPNVPAKRPCTQTESDVESQEQEKDVSSGTPRTGMETQEEGEATDIARSVPLHDSASDQDVHAHILSILQERVEERKKDPNYKPVVTASDTSKIPVKSTTKKFQQLHTKTFNKMTSIVDYQRNKEQRAVLLGSAKRPKLSPSRRKTTAASSTSTQKAFKPTITAVKNTRFDFSTKTPGKSTIGSAVKTPKAGPEPPTRKSTAKKSQVYKPHRGKLPEFNFSIF